MSRLCDNCGKSTRELVPVLNPAKNFSASKAFDPDRIIPRSALGGMPWIAWGEHPDDDNFQTWCRRCAA